MQEFIAVATPYNTVANRNPQRVNRTDIGGSNPATSVSGTIDVAVCPIPTPTSVCIWNVSVGNIGQTPTPNFRKTS